MGISALAVVACHFHSYLASGIISRLLGEGFIGVDIFIFCSGFGLVTSWRKSDSFIEFYKKRIKKILPTFLIITTIALLFCTYLGTVDYDFKDWLLILTSLGYWIGTDTFFEWYTPAILMLYFIFPFLYLAIDNKKGESQQKKRAPICIFNGILWGGVIISTLASSYLHPYHYWLIARIPIFMLGIFVGANIETNIPFGFLVRMCVAGILMKLYVIMGMSDSNNLNILGSSLITPQLIVGVLFLFKRMPLTSVLTLPGKCSYELFLIHFAMVRFNVVEVINPYVCLIASFTLSYLFHLAIAKWY